MKKNKLIKILIIITVILIILFGGAYLFLRSYIAKVNYQDDKAAYAEETAAVIDEAEIEADLLEDEVSTEPDSPETEIALLESQLQEQLNEASEVKFHEDVINILLIGSDSRQKGKRGRSDTIILFSVNTNTKEIYMTSFMRDCYVEIPGKGNNRINAAYAYGGASLLMDTLEHNFKIQVDDYAMIDFYSFVEIIDSIGGIELEVSGAEVEVMNKYIQGLNGLYGYDANANKLSGGGKILANGIQALGYARVRYVGNGDFERTQRQRTVIMKVIEKVKGMSLLEINDLLNVLLPEITTNLMENEIMSLLLKVPGFLQYDIQQLRVPVDGSYESMRINGMAVLGVDLKKNQDFLSESIYGE